MLFRSPKRALPDRERFPHLPHAPIIVDKRHFSDNELGLWGMTWEHGTVTGFLNGKQVASVTFAADPIATTMQVQPDATRLGRHDATRVMVRALDQLGNKLPFFAEPLTLTVTGAARLIGPSLIPFRAGSSGFWVQSTGAGTIDITVASDRLGTKTLQLLAE